MRRGLCAVLFALAFGACSAVAAEPQTPHDLQAAIRAYDQAQVTKDRAALERLLNPDYLLVNAAGVVQDKPSFIADSTASDFELQPFVVRDERIVCWHDGAFVSGVADLSGRIGGAPFAVTLRFVDIWKKLAGRWQVTYTQTTRVPATPP